MVWEVTTGRCVNILSAIDGGVGWPDDPRGVQWSPDGRLLGLVYSTNTVGILLPFGPRPLLLDAANVTDGWDSAPGWCWGPDSRRVAIDCWGMSPVPGCVATVSGCDRDEGGGGWMLPGLPDGLSARDEVEDDDGEAEPLLEPRSVLYWRDGRIQGHSGHGQAFAVEATERRLLWLCRVEPPVAWSPDGRWFAHGGGAGGLAIHDAATGAERVSVSDAPAADNLVWAPTSDRVAILVATDAEASEPGVHIVSRGGKVLVSVRASPKQRVHELVDSVSWAWSPDGSRGACLEAGGRASVWAFDGDEGARLESRFPVDANASAVLWGDVLVFVGPDCVVFHSADSVEPLAEFRPRHPVRTLSICRRP